MSKPDHKTRGVQFLFVCMAFALLIYVLLKAAAGDRGANESSNPSTSSEQRHSAYTYAFRSNVTGASLVQVDELPSVSSSDPSPNDPCSGRFIQPQTDGGRLAQERGWRVMQEVKFGEFDAVLIVRGLEFMTSNRCSSIEANVALFFGPKLEGVLYGKGDNGIMMSTLTLAGTALQVWNPSPLLEGQIEVDGGNVAFNMPSGEESVCNGRATVPVIYNDAYDVARKKLIGAGWRPLANADHSQQSISITDADRRKYPEIGDCAGTGYGECGFSFEKGEMGLGITTLGSTEQPVVSSYMVVCDKPA